MLVTATVCVVTFRFTANVDVIVELVETEDELNVRCLIESAVEVVDCNDLAIEASKE